MLPTIADLAGIELPADYEINGESLVPFLFTDRSKTSRLDLLVSWPGAINSRRKSAQGRSGQVVGRFRRMPADLIDFPEVQNWSGLLEVHREEREKLLEVLPKFDLYFDEYNAPGVPEQPNLKRPKYSRKRK